MANKFILDTQYFDERIKAGVLSGFGDLVSSSAAAIKDSINRVLADQQARLGRFLTYKQQLMLYSDRAQAVRKYDAQRGGSLYDRAQALLKNQDSIESQSLSLITDIANVKANPVVKLLFTKDITYQEFSSDLISRITTIASEVKALALKSTNVNSLLSQHEAAVNRLKSDIVSAEGDLAQRGLIPKVTGILAAPVSLLKYGAIIAGAGLALYLLPKILPAKKR